MTTKGPGTRNPVARRPIATPARPRRVSVAPLWAKLCVIIGAVVAVVGGATVIVPKVISATIAGSVPNVPILPPGAPTTIDGAINVLILGMDQRDGAAPAVERPLVRLDVRLDRTAAEQRPLVPFDGNIDDRKSRNRLRAAATERCRCSHGRTA